MFKHILSLYWTTGSFGYISFYSQDSISCKFILHTEKKINTIFACFVILCMPHASVLKPYHPIRQEKSIWNDAMGEIKNFDETWKEKSWTCFLISYHPARPYKWCIGRGSVFYLWLKKVSSNERWRNVRYIFSRRLRPGSNMRNHAIDFNFYVLIW